MKNYDEYLDLYESEDNNWYLEYVDKELKRLKRRCEENERKETTR